MSRKELALRTSVTEKHICTIINGDKGISHSLFARKIRYVFGDVPYWMNLQFEYDAYQLSVQEENNISQREIDLLKTLHDIMSYLVERGYLHNNCGDASKVMQLREFLQITYLGHTRIIQRLHIIRCKLKLN